MTNQRAPNHPSTNAAIRQRYVDGKTLNDGAALNQASDSPGNGSDTVIDGATDIHVVNPDGTNTVDLSNLEEKGRSVTVVHNGGSSTPTVEFDSSDFVREGPVDLINDGEQVTVRNIDGTSSGFVEADSTPRRVTATVSPGNGSDTTVAGTTEVHAVNPDGTNSVKLGNVAEAGRVVTIVHNGGSNTPTLSFSDSDFINTGPSNITTKGATATLVSTDNSGSGFAVIATGSG